MRSRADRSLPEEYRAWIDPDQPLPADVRLLPRQVKLGDDLVVGLGLGGLFAVMGTFFGMLLARLFRATGDGAPDPWGLLLLTAVTVGLWLVPLSLLRRLVGTIRASGQAKHGRLRQGLFLGTQGLLLRLAPNDCFLVSRQEFVAAKLRTNPRGPTRRQALFRIEIRDDAVEFFAERLQGQPDDVNGHARKVWGRRIKE